MNNDEIILVKKKKYLEKNKRTLVRYSKIHEP